MRALIAALLLLASCFAGSCAPSSRVAELDTVSPQEAIEACRPWAGKLGVTAELVYWRSKTLDGPLSLAHLIRSADGVYELLVSAISGKFLSCRNRQLPMRRRTQGQTRPGDLPEEELQHIRETLVRRLVPGFSLDGAAYFGGRYWEMPRPGVLTMRRVHVRLDPTTGDWGRLTVHLPEIEVPCEPRLSVDECQAAALASVRRWAGVVEVDINEAPLGGVLAHYLVGSDSAGVRRLVRPIPVLVYSVPRKTGVPGQPLRAFIYVDARTGECVFREREGRYPPRSGDETVPHLRLGEEPFGVGETIFPPRIRHGVPYLYVGYLDSLLWKGEVDMQGDEARIKYRGEEWRVKAGDATALRGEATQAFKHPPLIIREYLYLPAGMIEAITGWHVDYSRPRHTVYVYSRIEEDAHTTGEGP